jgi:hypothetical protein
MFGLAIYPVSNEDKAFSTERFPVDELGLEEAYRQVTDSLALMYEDWITSGNP